MMTETEKAITFTFSKAKFVIGLILGLLAAFICCFQYSWKAGVFFFVIFSLFGAVTVHVRDPLHLKVFRTIWLCTSIICTAEVSQLVADGNHLWKLPIGKAFLEVMCVLVVFSMVRIIVVSVKKAWIVSTAVVILLSFANFYVVKCRGNALIPLDILSYRTALNVVGGYTLTIYPIQFYGLILLIAWLFSSYSISGFSDPDKDGNQILARIKSGFLLLPVVILIYCGTKDMHLETFWNEGALWNGYLVNFTGQLFDALKDKKPKHYSLAEVEILEKKYTSAANESIRYPNIIVIMDESFVDFRVLGNEVKTQEPVMPFFDSMSDNTIRGYALASVFGGGTANSEYEFLTGNTMGFIADGATVYQLYLHGKTYSMASSLADIGYTCFATHPYNAANWERNRVWPLLGFDKVSFIDDYEQENLCRGMVSDQEMFEYIAKQFEDNIHAEPLFLFGVTMQNHGGYTYNDDSESVPMLRLEGYTNNYPEAEQYLGLIKESDTALEWLIHYFENEESPTVILFFGDHYPRMDMQFYNEIHGGPFAGLSEQQLLYTVPFIVWANFDIEEQFVPMTSLNYLSNYVYKAAGIEPPPYNQFLEDTENIICALNTKGFYSKQYGTFISYDEAEGEEAEALNKYRILQYNSIFDTENRSEVFFGIN